MSTDHWLINEYVVPASHIRGFERGTEDVQSSKLRLAVKQWIPRSNPLPRSGDVIIIMAHGVGSSKESYEPFFDELLSCNQFRIRAVWAMDVAWHGKSFLLNQDVIGDEPHWDDSSRDLLQMVNHFQEQMPPPIVGIGQSWGCYTIMMAALYHPRLFAGIVSLEPALATGFRSAAGDYRNHRAALLMRRRDTWPSREEARRYLLKSPYFSTWDPRVLERVVKYDLRGVPGKQPAVTLTTPKAMEVCTMMRACRDSDSEINPAEAIMPGFYCSEPTYIQQNLPHLLPPVLYVWGTQSDVPNVPGYREFLFQRTGTGPDGSGGTAAGRVQEAWVEGSRHPIPLEKPKGAAEAVSGWLNEEVKRWVTEQRESRKGEIHTHHINPAWMQKVSKI